MKKRDKEQAIKNTENYQLERLDKPRIPPLDEVDFAKELYLFHNAMNQLSYPNRENVESEWESEMFILVQWLKTYYVDILNDLISFLKLEEKELNINIIKSKELEDPIKSFLRDKGTIFNVIGTMTRYRKLRLKWILMASHVTYNSSLPPRDKEILILRIAWLCRAKYEWDHHVLVGKRVGLSNDEINQIKIGSKAQGWNHFDATLLCAVDELHTNTFLSEKTWKTLTVQYNINQVMDLTFVVGAYNMLAMFLNSFGVQTEDCVKNLLE
jgi:alkylhydroperoxidase family enzyme